MEEDKGRGTGEGGEGWGGETLCQYLTMVGSVKSTIGSDP